MKKSQVQENSEQNPIIIIGAGLGGLAAGALLAKKGKKVLVLEKGRNHGGFAVNFKRKDFTFDASLHATGGVEKTTYRSILEKCGVLEKVKFIKPQELYTSIFPDFSFTVKNGDIRQIKQDLFKEFPNQKLGIKLWFYFVKKIVKEERIWAKHKFIAPLAPLFIPVLLFSDKLPVSFFLNLAIRDKKLKALLTQLWPYWGLPPNKLAAQYFLLPSYGYFFDGAYYVRGGSQKLSDALREVIEANHGEVKTTSEVTEILIKDNKAIGVKTTDFTYFADNIIANISPHLVYGNLLANWQGAARELKKIEGMELSLTVTQIYLGLDCLIKDLYPKYRDAYEVFVSRTTDPDEIYRNFSDSSFERDYLSFNMTFCSNIESNLAPESKSVMSIIVGDNYQRWANLSTQEYKRKKFEEAEKLLISAEKLLPDLRKHIEVMEVATPKTMKRYTGNPNGAIYGFAQTTSQCGPSKRFSHQSPLGGLYFVGAWTFPGGGFEGTIRSANELVDKFSREYSSQQ